MRAQRRDVNVVLSRASSRSVLLVTTRRHGALRDGGSAGSMSMSAVVAWRSFLTSFASSATA